MVRALSRAAFFGLGIGLLTFGLAGCGRSYDATVSGMVTLDGELIRTGTVAFVPVGEGTPAYGHIRSDGSFVMQIGQGDEDDPDAGGIMPGKYRVSVVSREPAPDGIGERGGPPEPGRLLTPARYGDVATSGLEFEAQRGKNVLPIELTSDTSGEDVADAESISAADSDGASATETTPVGLDDQGQSPHAEAPATLPEEAHPSVKPSAGEPADNGDGSGVETDRADADPAALPTNPVDSDPVDSDPVDSDEGDRS